MIVPYTTKTGLKIGLRYLENGVVMPITDPDMLKLQRAFLSTSFYIEKPRQLIGNICLVILFALVIFGCIYK